MKTDISIDDFKFLKSANGRYMVFYTAPNTQKTWISITDKMQLIDAIRNSNNPPKKDLEALKRLCKKTGSIRETPNDPK
jgi:hypothetical protein